MSSRQNAKFPRLVGVSGFLRTGKDSVAALLKEFGYVQLSFAGPLRKMALDIDPMISLDGAPEEVCDLYFLEGCIRYSVLLNDLGYEKAKEVPDFRLFLQRLGTEGVRNNFGQDAWVLLATKAIEALPDETRIVFADVRFPNEAAAIHAKGGVVWRTERPGYDGGEHPSEAMVLKIIPDAILRAETLLDMNGNRGLGSLVLDRVGFREKYDLKPWAEEILSRA